MNRSFMLEFENKIRIQENKIKKLKSNLENNIITEEELKIIDELENKIQKVKDDVSRRIERIFDEKILEEQENLYLIKENYKNAIFKYKRLHCDDKSRIFPYILMLLEEIEGERYTVIKGLLDNKEIVYLFLKSSEYVEKTSSLNIDFKKRGYFFEDTRQNSKYLNIPDTVYLGNANYELEQEDNKIEMITLGDYGTSNVAKDEDYIYVWDFIDEIIKYKIDFNVLFISRDEIENIYDNITRKYKTKNNIITRIKKHFQK